MMEVKYPEEGELSSYLHKCVMGAWPWLGSLAPGKKGEWEKSGGGCAGYHLP